MNNSKKNKLYVVIARRWGRIGDHSYLVGIYTTVDLAIIAADRETEFRGGKYSCWVEEMYEDTFYAGNGGGLLYKTECQNMA